VTLWWSGCFLITAQDIAQHDRGLQSPAPDLPEPEPEPSPHDSVPPEPSGHDTPEDALEIADTLSESRRCLPAEIEAPGDVDWYRFTGAVDGEIIAVSTVAASADPPSPTDTVLTREAGGTSNDSMYGEAGTDSALMLSPGEAVQVSALDPTAGGEGHPYEVCAQLVPLLDLEPNDTPSQASGLSPDPNAVLLVGGWWDGSPDVYALSVRASRVYRVSMLHGHALGATRLVRLQQDASAIVQSTDQPEYDDRPWGQGYPPDAGLMFRDPSGTAWLAVEGGDQHGPYALAIQELEQDVFPAELEPNDELVQAQLLALVLQPDGTYLGEMQGTLELSDPQDMLLLESPEPGLEWGDLELDFVLQSASVGSSQDLGLALYDPATDQIIGSSDLDPAGLIDPDPVLLGFEPGTHRRFVLGIRLQSDPEAQADPWFLTVRVHP
jgi:hypothetical protein